MGSRLAIITWIRTINSHTNLHVCRLEKRESRERHIHIERERGEREERDAQSLQGMSMQFHFQFQNALISKGIISNRIK